MSRNKKIYILLGLLIVLVIFLYILNSGKNLKKSLNNKNQLADISSVISNQAALEENKKVAEAIRQMNNDYDIPQTVSFSNVDSNKDTVIVKAVGSVKKHPTPLQPEPVFFGVYYLDLLEESAVDNCKPRKSAVKKESKEINYKKDHFTFKSALINTESSYIFVDSKEVPSDVCAYNMQFSNITSYGMNNIYIIITEE